MVIHLRRRSWFGRLIRVPHLARAHHRAGLSWPAAVRLALLVLR